MFKGIFLVKIFSWFGSYDLRIYEFPLFNSNSVMISLKTFRLMNEFLLSVPLLCSISFMNFFAILLISLYFWFWICKHDSNSFIFWIIFLSSYIGILYWNGWKFFFSKLFKSLLNISARSLISDWNELFSVFFCYLKLL